MARFSPTVRPTSRPGGLGALAEALQAGVAGYQGQRDRQEGQMDRQWKRNVQQDTLFAETGLAPQMPEQAPTFGSAFAEALAGAPPAQPTVPPAIKPRAFNPKTRAFDDIDIETGESIPTPSGGTLNPAVPRGIAVGNKLATGRADITLGTETRDQLQQEFGPTVEAKGGTPTMARDLPTARSYMAKEDLSSEPLVIVDGPNGPTYVPRSQAIGAKPGRSSASGGAGDSPSMIMRLRADYRMQPAVKNYRTIQTAYERIQNTQDTAVGDLSLIFAYMKMLDPESVVRETEFANAQNAAGVPDQVRNLWNRALNGERLNPNQRAQFRQQAQQLAIGARAGMMRTNEEFKLLAKEFGIDPALIFTEEADAPPPQGQVDIRAFAPGRKF